MHKQFRRFDIIFGAVFAVLVIVGVLTVSSGSKPMTNSSRTVRATAAAGPASAPAVVPSGTLAPPASAPPTSAPPTSAPASQPPATAPAPARTARARTAPAAARTPAPAHSTEAAPPPSATEAAPAAPAACTPKTDGGNCYEPGEFCRDSDHGGTGVAGDGKAIRCEDNDGWRWEPVRA